MRKKTVKMNLVHTEQVPNTDLPLADFQYMVLRKLKNNQACELACDEEAIGNLFVRNCRFMATRYCKL